MTDTARLRAAGITRVPFSLQNADAYCAGKRLQIRNSLLPLCIACDIRDPGGRMEPPAVQGAGGVWGCSVHGADCAPQNREATPCNLGRVSACTAPGGVA
jgi:hypothetical protein